MFEELTPEQGGANEPADILEKVDPATSQVPTPSMNSIPAAPQAPTESKLSLILAIVGGLIVLGLIAYLGYRIFSNVSEVKNIETPITTTPEVVDTTPAATEPVVTPEQVIPEQVTPEITTPVVELPEINTNIDSDGDGITDTNETALGTNPNSLDTDSDGLFDNEEVNIYKTNPTNPDTDGDTFLDGQEVSNGYNPNGPGRLFNVNQ